MHTPLMAETATDTQAEPQKELTAEKEMADLLSAKVDLQTKEQDLRAVAEAMRHEALLLTSVSEMLDGAADYLDQAAVSVESSIEAVQSVRKQVPKFGEAVSDARFRHMTRGVNMSHWFSQSDDGQYDPDFLKSKYTRKDFDLIRSMGFRHVRFPFDESVLFNPDEPTELKPDYIELYLAKLDEMLDADLAVIVVIQPSYGFKQQLLDPAFEQKVATFWQALASRLSSRDPDRVYLDVLNEPALMETAQWRPIQWRLLQAMRAGAPDHTLIASGGNYSGPEDLLKLEPYADRNIVYNWHYYKPFAFTHQGAAWGKDTWAKMADIPWPMDISGVRKALDAIKEHDVRMDILGTTWTRGSEAYLRSDLQRVADWAANYGVRVTANELGVYTLKADRESRLRWHHVVTSTLDDLGIGWAIWDYSGGFDVVKNVDGKRVPDEQMLEALGMSPSGQASQQ